jgi:hypothetical protein
LIVDDDAAEATDGANNTCATDPAVIFLDLGNCTRTTNALVLWTLTLGYHWYNEEKRQDSQPTSGNS